MLQGTVIYITKNIKRIEVNVVVMIKKNVRGEK